VTQRPVIHDGQLEGWSCCRGFPLPFGHRLSLLGHPIPAGELGSPHGRLTGPRAGPLTGLPRSARTSCDRSGCPLTPGTAVLIPVRGTCPAGACRSTAASPSTPLQHPTLRGSTLRGINEGLRNLPVRSSPCLRSPGWNGPPLGLSPEASAARQPGADDARQGRGQAIEHGPGQRRSTTSAEPPILRVHSIAVRPRVAARSSSDRGRRPDSCFPGFAGWISASA
jgi:hypothetical protein